MDGTSHNDLDIKLREENETKRSFKREPSEASQAAAFDRLVLPHLAPIDLFTTPLHDRMIVDHAQNVFVFVNPTSGGNAAAAFMEAGLEHIRLTLEQPVNLWIWDIRQGCSGQKPGFLKLKRIVEALKFQQLQNSVNENVKLDIKRVVYVIVAGGDGTVMWCITEMWAHGIDDKCIAVGVVPYGTGKTIDG